MRTAGQQREIHHRSRKIAEGAGRVRGCDHCDCVKIRRVDNSTVPPLYAVGTARYGGQFQHDRDFRHAAVGHPDRIESQPSSTSACDRTLGLGPSRLTIDALDHVDGANVLFDAQYRTLQSTWGATHMAAAGMLNVRGVDISMPTGMHSMARTRVPRGTARCGGVAQPEIPRGARSDADDGGRRGQRGDLAVLAVAPQLLSLAGLDFAPAPDGRREAGVAGASAARACDDTAVRSRKSPIERVRSTLTPLVDGIYHVDRLHIPSRLSTKSDASPRAIEWIELVQDGHFNDCDGRVAAIRELRYGLPRVWLPRV
jgi:hypothetical protein